MIRFAQALSLCGAVALAAMPAVASDLVVREVLQEEPLTDAPDMTVRITRVTLKPGGVIERHAHAGDEHLVVLTGGKLRIGDGQEITLAEGTVMFHSAGDGHGPYTNLGTADIVVLTTHVVRVYEPFSWPVE
ncbi:cupin domain-containing protein [Maliponia aquimaris]|uniref:Cupin domain protein n=1 Tax=Maliponia aquimaris TaxID=1673631 RepID=A0A238K6B7_9RHOB|nr:cupin domain-containing protein [Maliponia aquimaris]SMX38333.1 Cupin domain protein [Maliponia aquimaris]